MIIVIFIISRCINMTITCIMYRGMTVTSGVVTLQKDSQNLIGISIGGGAPLCPCLYVVQIFDNTPAAKDGTLASGDEIVAVNSETAKGRTKVEVAKMIQSIKASCRFNRFFRNKHETEVDRITQLMK